MKTYQLAISLVLATLISLPLQAAEWSDWERAHAVARHRDFLVIRDPEDGGCYLKQSYHGQTNRMELLMAGDGVPVLTTPFYGGIDDDLIYAIDKGPEKRIRSGGVSIGKSLALPKAVLPELRAGWVLKVKVKPVGQPWLEQRFSLKGFTAASRRLHAKPCR